MNNVPCDGTTATLRDEFGFDMEIEWIDKN